jgi:class 3 adenylate cyclase
MFSDVVNVLSVSADDWNVDPTSWRFVMHKFQHSSADLPSGLITTMFTDIVSSTKLKNMMEGETVARRDAKFRSAIKEPHDKAILSCVQDAGGREVKPTGDGYICTFTDAEEAVLCALKIQDKLRLNPIVTPLGPLQIRIGLHTGMASAVQGDYISSAMDKAACVQTQAMPGDVFVSEQTHVLVRQLRGVTFELVGVFELKGLASENLYRVRRFNSTALDESRLQNTSKAELQNPYEFALTANPRTFKGRELETQELIESIESGTHTAVFGLQRMGKTSLIEEGLRRELDALPELSRTILPIKIDIQRLGGTQVTYRDFVHAIIEAIVEKISEMGLGRSVQNLRALTRDIFNTSQYQRGDRTEFFSVFAKILGGLTDVTRRRIILFLDEFSEVRRVIERNKIVLQNNPSRTSKLLPHDMYIDVPFIHHLGSLLKDQNLKKQITFIVTVRPFIAEYDEREELQLLKLMKPITLYHLQEAAAKELITEPLKGQVTYDPRAVDYLYRLTVGHPYLLQFMLKLVIDKINRERRSQVRREDIKSVEERMTLEGPAFDAQFAVLISDYSIDEVTHPKEALLGKGLLALIAHRGQEQDDSWVSANGIFEALTRHKVPIEKTASLLSQLTRTKILEEMNLGGDLQYRLSIPLLRERFVRQNLYFKYIR